jgi:ribosomal-protein-alanine N-acetyltransferase
MSAPFLHLDVMRLGDVPIVAELELLCFTSPWSESAYRHELTANPRSFYYVIRASVQAPTLPPILGYGGYWLLGDEAHIVTIASHPAYRGRSLGELMLLLLIGRARETEILHMTLEVRPSNTEARALYAKWGFEVVGLRKRYYRDTGEDAILMTLSHIKDEAQWAPMASRFEHLLATLDAEALSRHPARRTASDGATTTHSA